MIELGKPIHTFDAAAVHGGRIVVRRARPGERLETLDHVERELHPETLVIADPEGPIAIGGVMGGAGSEIGPGTTDVVVESAIFDPVSIRRTAFRYALRSEASLRFEKGQESRLARLGADRTARLIVEWAGGTVDAGAVDTDPVEPEPPASPSGRRGRTGCSGVTLDPIEQRSLLARVGIETTRRAARAPRSRSPPARKPLDVEPATGVDGRSRRSCRPGAATSPSRPTSIEEIARVRGYEHVPPILPAHADAALPARPAGGPRRHPRDARRGRADRGGHLRARGAARWSSGSRSATTAPPTASRSSDPPGGRWSSPTRSRASTRSCARACSAASSRSSRRTCATGRDDVAIFEIGKGYGATGRAADPRVVAARVRADRRRPSRRPGTSRPAPYDLDDAKGILELLARRARPAGAVVRRR